MVTGLNIIGSNKALQDHWVKRVIAYIIDWIIVWVISTILVILLLAAAWSTGGFFGLFFGLGVLVVALIAILYWVLQEAFMGGTIGKKIMGLQVVGTTGPMDVVKAVIRNVSKIHWILLLLDWLIGLATEGDPRQKVTDRFAGTTVVRTDQQAYMEEQFRQMATPPPHPVAPQAYPPQTYAPPAGYQQPPPQQAWQPAPPAGAPPQQAAPPQAAPPQQTWPGQQAPPAGGGWPQHQWDPQGQLVQTPRFCQNCGGPLVARGDGRMTCSRCGAVY